MLATLARADPAPSTPGTVTGWLITAQAFQSELLPRSFLNDRIRDVLGYPDDGPVRAFDIDLNDDGRPERFIAGHEKACSQGSCPLALLDGKSLGDIGRFFGTLIVLDRRANGWAVLQTLNRGDDEMSNLTTYSFGRLQYQPDDATLIDEAGIDMLLREVSRKP